LRDLVDFLDQNPEVPTPRRTDLLIFPPEASDAEMFVEIDTIAELIGSTASDADSPRGHYSAVRDFGPVQYRAVAIPYSARNNEGAE
jgi:hypothetical protein